MKLYEYITNKNGITRVEHKINRATYFGGAICFQDTHLLCVFNEFIKFNDTVFYSFKNFKRDELEKMIKGYLR